MKYLFGRVLICKNIDVATSIMRKTSGLISITLEGDKVLFYLKIQLDSKIK